MARRQHSESVESLVEAFVERLFETIELTIAERTRILATEWIGVAVAARSDSEQALIRAPHGALRTRAPGEAIAAEGPVDTGGMDGISPTTAAAPARRQRSRARVGTSSRARVEPPAPTAPSPEQERRDSEFARLRVLLKPVGHDDASGNAALQSPWLPLVAVDPPADPFRLLEAEIRSQAHGLSQLSPACCTARIAAWAGRVRSYEETNGNRVAADLLLDKLRVLARAMDAGRIEALNGAWRTSDWPSYIRTNETLAEAPQTSPEAPAKTLPEPSDEPDYRDVWSQPS